MILHTTSDINRISKGLKVLSELARKELNVEMSNIIELYSGNKVKQALYFSAAQELFTKLVGKYGTMAQEIAFEALGARGIPIKSVESIYQTMNAGAITSQAIKNPNAGVGYLNNSLDNAVKRGYRDTIKNNSERWARVPSGEYTCPWCVMLASRGFVFHTEEAAGGLWNYHAYCDCVVVPARDREDAFIGGYNPNQLYELYKDGKPIGTKPDNKTALNTEGNEI